VTGRPRPAAATRQQRSALQHLREIARTGATPLLEVTELGLRGGVLAARVRLDTSGLTVAPGGLPVRADHEDVTVHLTAAYPLLPPVIEVAHDRFLGHPHVLQGSRLCIYLEPDVEWHPDHGEVGFLTRLWDWLRDATASRFDASSALYHPVGGVLHRTPGAPTVVVRRELDFQGGTTTWRRLHQRSPHRLDLSAWSADGFLVPVLRLPGPLHSGAGTTVARLYSAVRAQGGTPATFRLLPLLAQASAANPADVPAYFILAVPGPSGIDHLLCGRVAPHFMCGLRAAAVRDGPLLQPTPRDVESELTIEWCTVSEERASATTRRDAERPVQPFQGRHVIVWGCGGVGSWTAELLARAGVARLSLCDPAAVTGGILVRQDYGELDVGTSKAEALANRVRALRDDLRVDVIPGMSIVTGRGLPRCDAVIDATVSNTVGVMLRQVWQTTTERPLVARMSTDKATCTLAVLTVTTPGSGPDTETVDRVTGELVAEDASLQPFRGFWEPPQSGHELVPAPGCSTPTFHGSAADLVSICGSLTSLLGPHLGDASLTGSHLVAAPHTSTTATGHRWLDCSGRG